MKCDDIDRIVVLSIIFALLGDILALGVELLSQRCTKKEELEESKEKAALNKRLDDFERRISKLENS
ncbi:MAG: hypothetical protein GX348_03640 [Veillonellaceae bacterium]|jgi:hypothetical protein|nr:hypothetical protein [Veillonellaceae bacterium]